MRRVVLSLFALLVVYANVANLSYCVPGGPLPQLPGMMDTFWLFNVFEGYHEFNSDIVVEAQVDGRWERVPETYFPYRRGEKTTRLKARRRIGRLAYSGEEEARAILARKIRDRYNREHASAPAERVRFVLRTWPRRLEQYGPDSEADVTHDVVFSE